MLDVLEHFSYRDTDKVLNEVWRILKPDAFVDIQVPDFLHCASAAIGLIDSVGFKCNVCGSDWDYSCDRDSLCQKCGQGYSAVQDAAIHRLYGGQDRKGNWHYTAFTESILKRHLKKAGFDRITSPEFNENGETFWQNWNFKLRAFKGDPWE